MYLSGSGLCHGSFRLRIWSVGAQMEETADTGFGRHVFVISKRAVDRKTDHG